MSYIIWRFLLALCLTVTLLLSTSSLAGPLGQDWKWNDITETVGYERYDACAFVYNSYLWVTGGHFIWYWPDGSEDDIHDYSVRRTINGRDWELVSRNLPRSRGATIGFENRLWQFSHFNIYSSYDGIEWQEAADSPSWGETKTAIVFENAIYVTAKRNADETSVWKSQDGILWEKIFENYCDTGDWRDRADLLVFQDDLWVIVNSQKLWRMEGGIMHPVEQISPAPSSSQILAASGQDTLWMLVHIPPGDCCEGVWYGRYGCYVLHSSADGQNWCNEGKRFSPDLLGGCFVYHKNKLLLFLGRLPSISYNSVVHISNSSHSADTDDNMRINLSELLRVVYLYNKNQSYRCTGLQDSEDGYTPSDTIYSTCFPHNSDYAPQDWRISLRELLRLIQFYNSGGYYPCPGSEDGFCPGSAA